MSSYLNIYIEPKGKEEKIQIYTVSRSSDLYQFFYENNLSVYGCDNYKELTTEALNSAILDLKNEIDKDKKRLYYMEKQKEDVNEIIQWSEYLDDKVELLHHVQLIYMMLYEANIKITDVGKVYTNYD